MSRRSFAGFERRESRVIADALDAVGLEGECTLRPASPDTGHRFEGVDLELLDALCDGLQEWSDMDPGAALLDEAMHARHVLLDPEDAARQAAMSDDDRRADAYLRSNGLRGIE